ncbi:MAG TPA: sulfite exporter TauE/SafE family protein [Stellaceae bacterium]|nr:sulfite exporter TauE/SafE family protein [Stellaceae bacterium]
MNFVDWAGLAMAAFAAALLQAAGGFGFAIIAVPLFLIVVEPQRAVQLVIILSTVLCLAVLPGLWRATAPRLFVRLTLGSLAGLPLGLVAFRYADPRAVRLIVGTAILVFALLLALMRQRHGGGRALVAMTAGRDLATGAVSGIATSLAGISGPPIVIYLLLTEAPPRTLRATLIAYFALAYALTLAANIATIGVPAQTWLAAGILIPFAVAGGLVGRPLGDRLGAAAFAALATGVLAAAGLYILFTAAFAAAKL